MKETTPIHGRFRRWLATGLAATMALSCMPITALAEEPNPDIPATDATMETALLDVPGTNEKVWAFTTFGTSTDSTINTVGEGANINGTVTLNSCTFKNDGTISKKGGKYVSGSPADGASYYYTTIDPATENFYLQADVTIDYINPSPDGQEGFALMLRDSYNGSGSYMSNMMSVSGTKLPSDKVNGTNEVKDAIGVRNYTGVNDSESAEQNSVAPVRFAFTGDKIEQGKTYRVSLEKTSYAYISTQYDIATGEKIGEYVQYIPAKDPNDTEVASYDELNDPMMVQEADKAYLALSTARGVNATFSNIQFTTSDWKASEWQMQPTTYIDPVYQITSPTTSATAAYDLVFKANADGKLSVTANGDAIATDVAVTAGTAVTVPTTLSAAETTFAATFTPNADFVISAFEKLSDYEAKTIEHTVTMRTLGEDGKLYVSQEGTAEGDGTAANPVDLKTAFQFAAPGQTILLASGEYLLDSGLTIARGIDGTEDAPITVTTADGKYATLNFNGTGTGLTAWGNWWHFNKLNITRTKDSSKGMQLSGSHCVVERCNFYNNGNSGLQISGSSAEKIDQWPSYNTILNCTSINNADSPLEDADGFAAKLTCGVGNVFDGCISAYNADDGWDLFAKAETGSIGAVVIRNSTAYRNGYLLVSNTGAKKAAINFAEFTCDDNGTLTLVGTIGEDVTVKDAGNGNGFKMGGTNLPGDHKLFNSIAYENKAKGIDSNSCPDVKVYNSTSFNNEGANVALYTGNKSATTNYVADGVLSFRTESTNVSENIKLQGQDTLESENNFFWDSATQTSHNSKGETVAPAWFVSLDTSVLPARKEDGSIDMHGLLLLSAAGLAATEAGAQGGAWGQDEATVWVVGDSTVSAFSDKYYLPRQGYGEQLSTYLDATVYNLAVSGASSKDFTGMDNYTALTKGSSEVPAMGSLKGDQFLLIGFGHNDEKTEPARYTNPNGDYKTEGSFANSLYTNYIKPALDAGVTPIVCTPIVRLTDENTTESYNSASGHITADTIAAGVNYAGGDYPASIRAMCEELGIACIDLTAQTIALNVEMGDDAQWMHSFTGAKYAEDGTTLVATGLDKTHTNAYGAKMNAWLIANTESPLSKYSRGLDKPSYDADFSAAVNPDYVPSSYTPPTTTSELWPAYTDAQGQVWYGSAFGNIGGAEKLANFSADTENGLTMGVTGNSGKIASTVDGIMMYYTKLPAGSNFTLTAKAKVNQTTANNQVSFGLMARDEMYIDQSIGDPIGDYVAAASLKQGNTVCFGRKGGALFENAVAEPFWPAEGAVVDLKIVGTADGYTLTCGNTTVSAGFDYPLTAIDSDNIYVGMFVARNVNVTFTDIKLTVDETKPEPTATAAPVEPTATPEPTAVPGKPVKPIWQSWLEEIFKPKPTPIPTATPEPTVAPAPTIAPTATPEPTAVPGKPVKPGKPWLDFWKDFWGNLFP